MANSNAHAVLEMLANEGLPVDPNEYAGTIDADQLKTVISKLRQDAYVMQPYTEEPSDEVGEQGAQMFSGGRSLGQLQGYIDGLSMNLDVEVDAFKTLFAELRQIENELNNESVTAAERALDEIAAIQRTTKGTL